MKLYYNPLSTYSQKVMIAFNEKGIAYEPVAVNLPKGEQAESKFKTVNPQGLVPALDDGGKPTGETRTVTQDQGPRPAPFVWPFASCLWPFASR